MSERFLKQDKVLQLNSQKKIVTARYSPDTCFYSQALSYTLIVLFLMCAPILLSSASLSPEESSKIDIGTYSPKEITLKLKRCLENSISVSLAPQAWKRAMGLIDKAAEYERNGKRENATKGYIEAGKILLSIEKKHPYKQISDTKIQLGQITLDKKSKIISFPAKITYNENMPVEVILSKPDAERSYETLFTSTISPLHLQTILYLAGYMNGVRSEDDKHLKQGDHLKLSVRIRSQDGKVFITKPVEDFLRIAETGEAWSPKYWVFVGSKIDQGRLVAELSGESILSWCVSPAIIQTPDNLIANGDESLILRKAKEFPDKSNVIFIISPSSEKK